jgi:hypothetical protein
VDEEEKEGAIASGQDGNKLVDVEERNVGVVSWRYVWHCLRRCGAVRWTLRFFFICDHAWLVGAFRSPGTRRVDAVDHSTLPCFLGRV